MSLLPFPVPPINIPQIPTLSINDRKLNNLLPDTIDITNSDHNQRGSSSNKSGAVYSTNTATNLHFASQSNTPSSSLMPTSTSPTPMSSSSKQRKSKTRSKKRLAALDFLSDSPKKKRGRKVKQKLNLPPIQKQPFFLVFPDLRLKCPQCDHIAICQGTLVQHLRTHPTSRKCPVCSKFSTQQNLIKHARLHSGERPYPCPIRACKWAYKQKGDLLAHIQRGKHGTSSDNNRKPPPQKFFHGSTKLPTLHAITQQDIEAAPDLKELIIALRKRDEMKKRQKEKVKQTRKDQLDDFVLSMFLSIYDIDNDEMRKLLSVAETKYKEKKAASQRIKTQTPTTQSVSVSTPISLSPDSNTCNNNTKNSRITHNEEADDENVEPDSADIDAEETGDIVVASNNANQHQHAREVSPVVDNFENLPKAKKVSIKFKYLVNRVYGDYSIVLVPIHSVPQNEIHETTPEIVIDPNQIPALQRSTAVLNAINTNAWTPSGSIQPPSVPKQSVEGSNMRELSENHIVLANAEGAGVFGRNIANLPRKRQYHKYNQTAEGFWQCDAPNCGSLFLSKESLETHCKQLHDLGYYGCKYCQRIYRSQKNVQNHLRKAHMKPGDDYLNAIIYNKFNQIARLKQSKWNEIRNKSALKNAPSDSNPNMGNNDQAMVVKQVVFKTHPIDHVALRKLCSTNGSGEEEKEELVPWIMLDKKKKGRGRGRPRRAVSATDTNNNNSSNTRRPRGRPKGSKNKPKTTQQSANTLACRQRRRRRPVRKHRTETDEEEHDDKDVNDMDITNSEEESYEDDEYEDDYQIGTIYDDIDGSNASEEELSSSHHDEKSFLMADYKLDEYLSKSNKKRRRGRKRNRGEFEGDGMCTQEEKIKVKNEPLMKQQQQPNAKRMRTAESKSMCQIKAEPNSMDAMSSPFNKRMLPRFDIPANMEAMTPLSNKVLNHNDNNMNLHSISSILSGDTQNNIVRDLNQLNQLNNFNNFNVSSLPPIQGPGGEDLSDLLTQLNSNGATSASQQTYASQSSLEQFDYNSLIEFLSGTPQRAQSETGHSFQSLNSLGQLSNNNMNTSLNPYPFAQNQIDPENLFALNCLLQSSQNMHSPNQSLEPTRLSATPQHAQTTTTPRRRSSSDTLRELLQNGGMLNNYGNIVNNTYQISRKVNTPQSQTRNKDERAGRDHNEDKSESPFVPPLVEAVCGAPGCIKTKRDDGSQLLLCGRCLSVKYCSKRCQLQHIYEHRKVCEKKKVKR